MSDNDKCAHEFHKVHDDHKHEHGEDCGHAQLVHDNDHIDYLHKDEKDGILHLHHKHEEADHWHDCVIKINDDHPVECMIDLAAEFAEIIGSEVEPIVGCEAHEDEAVCGKGCGQGGGRGC